MTTYEQERAGRKRAERMLEELVGHAWVDAEPSASGKAGFRCLYCDHYTNAPVKAVYSPCPKLVETVKRAREGSR
ncbi:MAG: hypothetical protein ACM359_00170 [Bacillota bacterium]